MLQLNTQRGQLKSSRNWSEITMSVQCRNTIQNLTHLTRDLTFTINETQKTDGRKSIRHEDQTFNIF